MRRNLPNWLAVGLVVVCSVTPPALAAPFDETPRLPTPPPPGSDLERYYPQRARDQGVEGSAVIECSVGADGRLSACAVVSETPPGSGFGQASIRAAAKFRMKASARSRGRRVAGDGPPQPRVRIPLNWSLSAEPDGQPQPLPIPTGAP